MASTEPSTRLESTNVVCGDECCRKEDKGGDGAERGRTTASSACRGRRSGVAETAGVSVPSAPIFTVARSQVSQSPPVCV